MIDEAYERSMFAYTFVPEDHDLRDAKENPMVEHDDRDWDRGSQHSSNSGGHGGHRDNRQGYPSGNNAKRARRDGGGAPPRGPTGVRRRVPLPPRLMHCNRVCYHWVTDHNETVGQTCDTPTCRYDHAWQKNAS